MRLLLEQDRATFFEEALAILRSQEYNGGHHYLLTLLVMSDLFTDTLLNPAGLSTSEALRLARHIADNVDPSLDVKLVRLLLPTNGAPAQIADGERAGRVLEIVGGISDGARVMTLLTQLLNHADIRLRSKAALLVGRINHTLKWVEQRMADSNPRVRANAIEALWGLESPEARQAFAAALKDTDNRVAGNAALGLYRAGDQASIEALVGLIESPDSKVRATGAWAMGATRDPRFLSNLTSRMVETDSNTRQNVFQAISAIRQHLKAAAELPSFRVAITRINSTPAGCCQVHASVIASDRRPVGDLKPLEFSLTEADKPIHLYSIQERREPEQVVAGLVIPRGAEAPAIKAAVGSLLAYKRKADAWTMIKYHPSKEEPRIAFRPQMLASGSGGPSQGASAEVCSPEPADLRFTSDARWLLSSTEITGPKDAAADSATEAVRQIISRLEVMAGARHVFLVGTPLSDAGWPEMIDAARRAEIAIHTIGVGADPGPALSEMCRSTGGFCGRAESSEQIVSAVRQIGALMFALYTIEFASVEPKDLHLRVCSGRGFGEAYFQPDLAHSEVNGSRLH